ncbi:MAG: hypothetical protein K0B14_13595 [Anaerolineaceae bacterium]|nr:hypothetical protein [Anaerolineaceae bacterium]
MLSLFDSFIAFILMIFGASFVLWLEYTQQSFFATRLDISVVILFLLVTFLLIPVTKAQTGKRNPWMYMIPVTGGVLFILLAEFLRALFYDVNAVRQFLDGSVQMVHNVVILMIYLLSVPLFLMLKQISRKRMIG